MNRREFNRAILLSGALSAFATRSPARLKDSVTAVDTHAHVFVRGRSLPRGGATLRTMMPPLMSISGCSIATESPTASIDTTELSWHGQQLLDDRIEEDILTAYGV